MKRNPFRLIAFLAILSLLVSLPLILHKHKVEQTSKQVEFMTSFENIQQLSSALKEPQETLYASLKDDHVTSITLSKNSLKAMENRGFLSVFSYNDFNHLRSFLGEYEPKSRETSFVVIYDRALEKEIGSMIETRFGGDILESERYFKGHLLYEIDQPASKISNLSLPFLQQDYEDVLKSPFQVVPIVENDWEDTENAVINQITGWKKDGKLSKVLYLNGEILGYPKDLSINEPFSSIGVGSVEMIQPKETTEEGTVQVAEEERLELKEMKAFIRNNMVRTHVIPAAEIVNYVNRKNLSYLSDRVTLAVKERNIRSIYVTFPTDQEELQEVFDGISAELQDAGSILQADGYTMGVSQPFEETIHPFEKGLKWTALLLGIVILNLFLSRLSRRLAIGTGLVMIAAGGVSFAFQMGLLYVQVVALLLALTIPLIAVVTVTRWLEKTGVALSLRRTLVVFIGISLVTILFAFLLPAIHFDLRYVLYLEQFRGVQLLHVVPVFFAALWVLWIQKPNPLAWIAVLKKKIAVYHVVLTAFLVLILGAAGLFYLMRTGNGGTLLPFEKWFRHSIEQLFGIRPRTKEFLIGHPLLIVCLYYWNRHRWMRWTLPLGVVGQLSMVNTFTHFHTPFVYSLARSFYGIGLSLILGILLIIALKLVTNSVRKSLPFVRKTLQTYLATTNK